MLRQETDWGEILWLTEDKEILSIQGLQVGLVSLFTGRNQPAHIHYDEQVIYVVQGQALSVVDGVESSLRAGDYFHWKAGVEHQVYNIGNVPFQHLLISNPVMGENEEIFPDPEDEDGAHVSPDLIYIAAEAIRTQFLETLHYAYAIFDAMGNLVPAEFFLSRLLCGMLSACGQCGSLPVHAAAFAGGTGAGEGLSLQIRNGSFSLSCLFPRRFSRVYSKRIYPPLGGETRGNGSGL